VKFHGNALTNRIEGGSGDDAIWGEGGQQDVLLGGAGNDALTGGSDVDFMDGGTGADTMTGLGGNDTYIVDNAKDVVSELSKGGTDEVDTTISLLSLFQEVENLVLRGTGDSSGRGNRPASSAIAATTHSMAGRAMTR